MPTDRNADGTPETPDNFPPHHIFVGVFFTTIDSGKHADYIVTNVDSDKRLFWAINLETMQPYDTWVPIDIKLDELPAYRFRKNARLISHGAGITRIERTLAEARNRNAGLWHMMLETFKIWRAQRLAHRAILKRYQEGPLKALAARSHR